MKFVYVIVRLDFSTTLLLQFGAFTTHDAANKVLLGHIGPPREDKEGRRCDGKHWQVERLEVHL
jgi:hypothetical protein